MIPDPVPRCSHCRTRTDDLYRTAWGDLCDRCVTLQEEHDAYAAASPVEGGGAVSQEPQAGELEAAPIVVRVMDDPRWEVTEWRDIDYLARVKADDVFMDFEVYEVVSWGYLNALGEEVGPPILELAEWHASGDETQDITQSAPLFQGRVKWDGCSDWDWNQAKMMWHGCSPRDVTDLTEAMRRTYALAADRIGHWDPM